MQSSDIAKIISAVVGGIIILAAMSVSLFMIISRRDDGGLFQNLFMLIVGLVVPSPLNLVAKKGAPGGQQGITIGTQDNGLQLTPGYAVDLREVFVQ